MVHPHNIPRIQPGTHPEDAQPSESAPSNRRISFPPQVLPAHQPGRAGGWANAGQSRPQAQGRGNGLFIPQRGGGGLGRGGARGGGGYRPPRGRGGGANAPYIIPPRNNRGENSTVAGGWASSALFAPLPARPDDSTVASRSGGKGKGREVEGALERPSSTNGGYADYFSQKQQQQQYQQPATPIAVPQNPRATLFVKGFYGASTEEDVRAIFAPYGPVCVLPCSFNGRDTDTSLCRTARMSEGANMSTFPTNPFFSSPAPPPPAPNELSAISKANLSLSLPARLPPPSRPPLPPSSNVGSSTSSFTTRDATRAALPSTNPTPASSIARRQLLQSRPPRLPQQSTKRVQRLRCRRRRRLVEQTTSCIISSTFLAFLP